MLLMNNILLAKLGYTFCLSCIDQNPTLYIGKSFQTQVHQSRHQEWKETKKFLKSWSTALPSKLGCPLGVVPPRSRRKGLLCKCPWAKVREWWSGWPVTATLMGFVPSYCAQWDVYGKISDRDQGQPLPKDHRKVPIDGPGPESRQNIRSVSQSQDQKSKNTCYSKDPGWLSQVKEGGRPQEVSSFSSPDQGPTAVPCQRWPWKKASKPLGKVKEWQSLWMRTGSWLSVGSRNAKTASVYMLAE